MAFWGQKKLFLSQKQGKISGFTLLIRKRKKIYIIDLMKVTGK
jgi:hypothetical protein